METKKLKCGCKGSTKNVMGVGKNMGEGKAKFSIPNSIQDLEQKWPQSVKRHPFLPKMGSNVCVAVSCGYTTSYFPLIVLGYRLDSNLSCGPLSDTL